MKFKAGDKVTKIGGSFAATGTVVSAFANIDGEPRYVMEFDSPKGMLHIYTEKQLVLTEEQGAESRVAASYFADVKAFHDKFDLGYDGPPRMMSEEEVAFRWRFLNEEMAEIREELQNRDLAQLGGELADLIWIACGVAHRCGLDLDAHWAEIRRANMSKVRASAENPGKRGSKLDIVKPEGWRRPDHGEVLRLTYEKAQSVL